MLTIEKDENGLNVFFYKSSAILFRYNSGSNPITTSVFYGSNRNFPDQVLVGNYTGLTGSTTGNENIFRGYPSSDASFEFNLNSLVIESKTVVIQSRSFFNTSLEDIRIKTDEIVIENNAFDGSTTKTFIVEPLSQLTNIRIGKHAFLNCKGLKDFQIKGELSNNVRIIDPTAFEGCAIVPFQTEPTNSPESKTSFLERKIEIYKKLLGSIKKVLCRFASKSSICSGIDKALTRGDQQEIPDDKILGLLKDVLKSQSSVDDIYQPLSQPTEKKANNRTIYIILVVLVIVYLVYLKYRSS
jgi:hypothetical protein